MSFEQVQSSNKSTDIFVRKKKKVNILHKSLAVFLLSLQGERITLELKDDSEVSGILVTVSNGMDITLSEVRKVDSTKTVTMHDEMSIIGKSMRYCFVPKSIPNAARHLNNYVSCIETTSLYRGAPIFADKKLLKRKIDE